MTQTFIKFFIHLTYDAVEKKVLLCRYNIKIHFVKKYFFRKKNFYGNIISSKVRQQLLQCTTAELLMMMMNTRR